MDWTVFQQALHPRYAQQAQSAKDNGFWDEVSTFTMRAHQASYGGFQLPEELSERELNKSDGLILRASRNRILSAFEQRGRIYAPVEMASAQVFFDCWMYKVEDPGQAKGLDQCRLGFADAMAAAEKKIADANRVPPKVTGVVTLLDGQINVAEGDKSVDLKNKCDQAMLGVGGRITNVTKADGECDLDENAQRAIANLPLGANDFVLFYNTDEIMPIAQSGATVSEIATSIAENIAGRDFPEVSILGHADRQGSDKYNMSLSKRRADSVRRILTELGIDPNVLKLEWFGENKLAVETADEFPEALNRRVEIRVR